MSASVASTVLQTTYALHGLVGTQSNAARACTAAASLTQVYLLRAVPGFAMVSPSDFRSDT